MIKRPFPAKGRASSFEPMDPRELRIEDFTYDLPVERIAQHPLAERDASKLLVYKDGRVEDDRFGSLAGHLPEGTLLVLNDTRVVKARMICENTLIFVTCLSKTLPIEQQIALILKDIYEPLL